MILASKMNYGNRERNQTINLGDISRQKANGVSGRRDISDFSTPVLLILKLRIVTRFHFSEN